MRSNAPAWQPLRMIPPGLGDIGFDQTYDTAAENHGSTWPEVAPGGFRRSSDGWPEVLSGGMHNFGEFDTSCEWMPLAQQGAIAAGGGSYDETGAWVPPPQPPDPDKEFQLHLQKLGLAAGSKSNVTGPVAEESQKSQQTDDPVSDTVLQARARASLAKAQFRGAIGRVARKEEPETKLVQDDSMCWDWVKAGHCSRGMACQWCHSDLESGAVETEKQATLRRALNSNSRLDRGGTYACIGGTGWNGVQSQIFHEEVHGFEAPSRSAVGGAGEPAPPPGMSHRRPLRAPATPSSSQKRKPRTWDTPSPDMPLKTRQ